MLKERMIIKRRKGILLTIDFSGGTIEDYAMAWLKLWNNARECSDTIWRVINERGTNKVYVICNQKCVNAVREFCTGIYASYKEEGTVYIGKVVSEEEIIVGVPVYEWESDSEDDDDDYENDLDNIPAFWMDVEE